MITAGIISMLVHAVSREQEVTDRRTSTEALARIEASLAAAHRRLDQLTEFANTPTELTDDSE